MTNLEIKLATKVTKKKKQPVEEKVQAKTYPFVTVGNHLTVTEFEDGRTELKWDDEALLNEVRAAISTVEK